MKVARQIFAGMLAIAAMTCFVLFLMGMQENTGQAGAYFLGFLFLGWIATKVSE